MPVAIKLAENTRKHGAKTSPEYGTSRTDKPKETPSFFKSDRKDGKGPITYSFANPSDAPVCFRQNGLAGAVIDAYNRHRHLVLRPEDIWLAILNQMNFYVNHNAECLSNRFLTRQVRESARATPRVVSGTIDVPLMMQSLLESVSENFADEGLEDWMVPGFSTTTEADKTAASIVFLAASTVRSAWDEYKDLNESSVCGIPSVTLLGKKRDWQQVRDRLEKFKSWGEQACEFVEPLCVVLDYFVHSFNTSYSEEIIDFWRRMVTKIYREDDAVHLSGWIESFYYWMETGQPISKVRLKLSVKRGEVGSIMLDDIPASASLVTTMVVDHEGSYVASLVAGSVGYSAASPDLPQLLARTPTKFYGKPEDAIQPSLGWCMYKGCGLEEEGGLENK